MGVALVAMGVPLVVMGVAVVAMRAFIKEWLHEWLDTPSSHCEINTTQLYIPSRVHHSTTSHQPRWSS